MTTTGWLLILIPIAYLLGSIPFGLIVGLSRGVDPRKAGSGNIGATNVGRLLGGKFFAIVFTLDLLKGLTPMLLGARVLHGQAHTRMEMFLWLLIAAAAIAGHMFSLFLKFKGGKGVATTLGAALGVWPYYTLPAVVAAAVFVLVFLITRIVSIGSIVAAIAFPIILAAMGAWLGWDVLGARLPLLVFAILIALLIVYRHRENIRRLLGGKEHAFKK
jgi:glycerol-3-phosphate acyltransferase PlsY